MRVPVVLQAARAECALACLAMIAAAHGRRETLREYRLKFQLSQRGMTLHRLRTCAAEIGFDCRAVRLELEELPQLRTPAILHWEFDHFVVLTAVRRGRATIVDPAMGRRRLALDELSRRFTGVALELAPTPAFTPKKKSETVPLSLFFSAFSGLARPLAVTFGMTLGLQAFALLMPLSTQFVVDQGIRQGDMNVVWMLALGFGLVAFISTLTNYFRSLLALYVGNTSAHRMVTGLAHHMIRLSDSWFSARHTGDVLSRFASTAPIRQFLMTNAFAMVLDGLLAIGALAIVVAYSWDMALAMLAFIALFAGLNVGTYARQRNLTEESIAAGARENSSFIENVERHRAIKLLGAEAVRENAWGERYVHSVNAAARLARFGVHVALAGGVVGVVENMVLLLLGAHKVIAGEFTLGMWFAFSAYGAMLSTRLQAFIRALVDMRMLRLHQERVADIGLEPKEIEHDRQGMRARLAGGIAVESLSFAYEGEERAVLDKLSLVVEPGEFVALVGESGRGKSTLIKIVCKLLPPTDGQVLVDGADLRHLDTLHYRRQLGVVMQDDDLFSGSLVENIVVDTEAPDMERVEWAASLACIHEDIQRMPMQYMTLIGHMGSTLSGGQRQRVMIARAIYRKPRVFLLDEGTAHLNDALQRRVLSNLREQGATVLAATHDPRVIEQADRVVELA